MNPDYSGALAVYLTAHLLADFLLQSKAMVEAREARRAGAFIGHVATHMAAAFALQGNWRLWPVVLGIGVTHLVIDVLKERLRPAILGRATGWSEATRKAWLLTGDQLLHFGVVLLAAGWAARSGEAVGWSWAGDGYFSALVYVAGFVGAVRVGALVVEMFATPLRDSAVLPGGLENGGWIIGQLERGLIYLLVITGNLGGVGFLTAAKSVFRFAEIKDSSQRKEAEYILIGTLLSFTWAIAIALLARALAGKLGG